MPVTWQVWNNKLNKPKNSKAGAKALESAVAAHKAGDIEKAETLYVKAISLTFIMK